MNADDRPLFPPKIKSTEVLYNPFDDIIPRQKKEETKAKPEEKKKKTKGTKNFSLLSFGEEAEEDESTVSSVSKTMKMKSSHDVLQDPKLSSQPVIETTATVIQEKKKSKPADSDEDSDVEIADETHFDSHMRDQVRSKLKKRKTDDEEKGDRDEETGKDASGKSKQEEARAEYKRLKREMMQTKRKIENEGKTRSESKESDVLAAFHGEQSAYLEKKKTAQKRKGEGRDEQNLALLASFKAKLEQSTEEEEPEEEVKQENQNEKEGEDDAGWMYHALLCESEDKRARDAFVEDEDTFEIFDPRNPINKRRREASKKSMKEKRR